MCFGLLFLYIILHCVFRLVNAVSLFCHHFLHCARFPPLIFGIILHIFILFFYIFLLHFTFFFTFLFIYVMLYTGLKNFSINFVATNQVKYERNYDL